MALEATHIRFALDIKDSLGVSDIQKYVVGSVYPDSRYVTGVDRVLTHDEKFMHTEFYAADDFKKGWYTHLIYDKIQSQVHKELFGELLMGSNPGMTSEEDWIIRSALKMVQDVDDVAHIDIKSCLEHLSYSELHNDEDPTLMNTYHQIIKDLYSDDPVLSLEKVRDMWVNWGVPLETANKMLYWANKVISDPELYKKVQSVYQRTLELYFKATHIVDEHMVMKLQPSPFQMIKNGTKKIELRLNDKKRKMISVDDVIVFRNVRNGEELYTKVTALHFGQSFKELISMFPLDATGSESDTDYERMYEYYSKEDEKKYGVVGIEIELV